MRSSIKRFTVAIAGVALAGGAVLATAPAAEAATTANRSVSVTVVTATGHDDCSDRCGGRYEQRYRYGQRHHADRYRYEARQRWAGGHNYRRHHHQRWQEHG